jgi:hypothetical protein
VTLEELLQMHQLVYIWNIFFFISSKFQITSRESLDECKTIDLGISSGTH